MSTIQEDREKYQKNPYFKGHIYGNFSPFYVTITICTVVLGSIILLNIILGCCSKYRKYWQDRHTGNRWLVSIWSATPHKQPPLDFTELKDASYYNSLYPTQQVFHEVVEIEDEVDDVVPIHHPSHHQRPPRPEGSSLQQQRHREEYVELQKRESDI